MYTLQTLIKVIVEMEDQFNMYLSYNILQLSLLRINLEHFDKFELQSLASSVSFFNLVGISGKKD